jgi:alkanesulfonate monooxygenase SsuD/methylene tetrahydromethanopterin reductase-like flavin-dependent oxidoreductase (luciferase family)
MGFGAIWSAETRHDPFLPLAVASTTTSRIGLGTAIAVAFPRSPMVLAHNERRFSVAWEPPGPRMKEVVQALRAIWDCWQHGTPLDFRGRSYRFATS